MLLFIVGLVAETATANISPPQDDVGYELTVNIDTPSKADIVVMEFQQTPMQIWTIQMDTPPVIMQASFESLLLHAAIETTRETTTHSLNTSSKTLCNYSKKQRASYATSVSWFGTNYFRNEAMVFVGTSPF